jgi:transketolase
VLACAEPDATIASVCGELGVTRGTVSKWRSRFLVDRLEGLSDEPRPGRPRTISDDAVEAVIVKTLEESPGQDAHWSTRSMAAATGMSQSAVSRIWRAFGLKPHVVDTWKLSTDPQFVETHVKEGVAMLLVDEARADAFTSSRRRLAGLGREATLQAVGELARQVRLSDLEMIGRAELGHIGGDFSVIDILATLYGAVLNIDPARPDDPERDRFILSKGHSAGALYATLAHCGFFPLAELQSFAQPLSALNGHPNRTKVPGVETNTGPLGHGFPVAVGCALAARLQRSSRRTFVVLGDGELQEGSNWEAAMTGSHYRLASLTAVVDRNRLQQGARTEDTKQLEPLADKWTSFGWEVRAIDGHDYAQVLSSMSPSSTGRPVCVLANTIKGKGVSFMEDRVEWHHKVPSTDQIAAARKELSDE